MRKIIVFLISILAISTLITASVGSRGLLVIPENTVPKILGNDPDGPLAGGLDDISDYKHLILSLLYSYFTLIGPVTEMKKLLYLKEAIRHSDEAFDDDNWAYWDS